MKNSATYPILNTNLSSPAVAELAASSDKAVSLGKRLTLLAGAFILGGGAAYCITAMISLAFDFAYELVKLQVGQPDSFQGVVAAMSLWFIVMPIGFGSTTGYLKKAWDGDFIWHLLPFAGVMSFCFGYLSLDWTLETMFEMLPWMAISTLAAYAAYMIAGRLFSTRAVRNQDPLLILSGVLSCIPAGVAMWVNEGDLTWQTEAVIFSVGIAGATIIAANAVKNRPFSNKLVMSVATLLPILLCVILNVSGNILAMFLDDLGFGPDLGWRALFSATIILSTTAASMGLALLAQHKLKLS